MAKFVLVDHSLRNVGGHQYEYANQILREAEFAGYEPVLATHRRFRPRASLPGTWQVYPLFQSDVYSKYAASWDPNRSRDELPWDSRDAENGESNATSCSPVAWVRRWRRLVSHLDRLRGGDRFELACRRLVQSVELQAGDIVFLATVSELDLQALTAFLQRDPRTQDADWHVQFHFDVLSGRDADYDFQQTLLQSMRSLFEDALHQIPDHRVFLHCTTAQLAAQYNRLIPGAFRELPFPVKPRFHESDRKGSASEPLRITCAGGMRREKGSRSLAALIRETWHPHLVSGHAQFHIQTNRRRFKTLLPKNEAATDASGRSRLVRVPHPLGMAEYVRLIQDSDIGLFLYDSKSYYTRCSGILVEMLASGVPVIVPAGCWLAEQVAEPIFHHLDLIRETMGVGRLLGIHDVRWDNLVNPRTLRFGGSAYAVRGEIRVPEKATGIMVRFRHGKDASPGTYVRVDLAQYDRHAKLVDRSTEVIGQRADHAPVGAFISLQSDSDIARFTLANAYAPRQTAISGFEFGFATAGEAASRSLPAGAVGLVAADEQQIPRLLADMIQHYGHYRESAELFSQEWMRRHSPQQTFTTLIGRGNQVAGTLRVPAA